MTNERGTEGKSMNCTWRANERGDVRMEGDQNRAN